MGISHNAVSHVAYPYDKCSYYLLLQFPVTACEVVNHLMITPTVCDNSYLCVMQTLKVTHLSTVLIVQDT